MNCSSCQTELPAGKFKCPACGQVNPPQVTVINTGHLVALKHIPRKGTVRLKTGPWDVCFGGGIFPKTVTLIGGKRGIGKSTLLLQLADAIAGLTFFLPEEVNDMNTRLGRVIYIHTEEGKEQVAGTADRIGLKNQERIHLLADTDEDIRDTALEDMLREAKPDLLILDSLPGFAGDTSPERALELIKLFKKKLGILTIITNHMNKEDDQAGYESVQHAVDAVMTFGRSEQDKRIRVLTTEKNRHGPDMVSCGFEMTETGLKFLSEEFT